MTSHRYGYRAVPAEVARRTDDGSEAGSYKTRAGLLTGLLLCSGSGALMIWLASLLF